MKFISTILLAVAFAFSACDNSGSKTERTDSSTVINTETGNVSDGGPNHGIGDTTSYDRMNDKIPDSAAHDTPHPKR